MKEMVKKTPFTLLYSIPARLFDMIAPPRPTQDVVRGLTHESLIGLANLDGSLPYHDARVRALIWELKYRADRRAAKLAGEYLAELLLAEASEAIGAPLVIPMPMHPARRRERGFNQTEVLCEAALKALEKNSRKNSLVDVPAEGRPEDFFYGIFSYAPYALQKIEYTAPQQGLPQNKRLKNVKNTMRADEKLVRGRGCIVVDDGKTTGASFKEAQRALRAAGARAVACIALAHS